MKKRVIVCTLIVIILVILLLVGVGMQYFQPTLNMILIGALGIFSIIVVSVFGVGAANYKALSENKSLDEGDKNISENKAARYPINETIAKEDGIIAALSDKLKEREEEVSKLQRANNILSEELDELKQKSDSPSDDAVDTAGESASALLPITDEDDTKEINIIRVCKDAIKDLSQEARRANLIINISTTEDSLLVKASRKRLIILFKNIIDNSIKYMNRQGSLTITISNIGSDIFIVLKDTGEGLTESETRHIFELNYQGSNRISGNGLGLAQAKAIVDYYGGTIYAKSNVNQGMAIYIQLPTT